MNIAIITDTFPPMVDGVSRCVLGYANALHERGYGNCIVIAPRIPKVKHDYPFPIYSFRSIGLPYGEFRAGTPFSPKLIKKLKAMGIDLLHVHSPFISMSIARHLRYFMDLPIVFSQHTKWDYDIARALRGKILQKGLERFAYSNLSAANELWAVSKGTGEYLISRGYKGSYIVMPNGTDFPKGDADPLLMKQISDRLSLPDGVPVLLFVGRMMWYKNIGLIIEALEILSKRSFDFRMIFVGGGDDLPDVKKMAAYKKLSHIIHFIGKVHNREELRAYYSRSDLFVFPSIYDNAPLVIREAAACACPALVVRNSSSAEILKDGFSGFFTDDNPQSIADALQTILSDRTTLKKVAANAAEHVYLPWDKAIEKSIIRYKEVIKTYNNNKKKPRKRIKKRTD